MLKQIFKSQQYVDIEKDPCQHENKNLIDKYKNQPFDEPLSETLDTLEAANRLLLFFHPGSVTQKPTKFDLRTLILFIWGRKRGAESGEEQLALSTTETKHLLVVRLGNHLAHTKSAFLTSQRVYFVIRLVFCVLVQLKVWQNVSRR